MRIARSTCYRARLGGHGPVGSTGRRGNPGDNAVIESFMKTLKVAGTSSMATDPLLERAPGAGQFRAAALTGPRHESRRELATPPGDEGL